MAYSMFGKRGYFYDVRNLPYSYYGVHPMEVLEYQRGRPTKLPVRLLNKQFKRTVIQLESGDQQQQQQETVRKQALIVSVQLAASAKGKQPMLVLESGSWRADETEADAAGSGSPADVVSLPESLAPQFVQQLRKLAKWKPGSGAAAAAAAAGAANPPPLSVGQGLAFEDTVFKAQIVCVSAERQQFAIKMVAEARARDPQERRELAAVQLPMEPANLAKLKSVLADLLVTESPLYHTESLQVSDGSKFYLDLIKEESAHYLKVSHVTRDFRSIVIVPAGDVEALRDLLDTSLKAIKAQQKPGEELASGKVATAAASAVAAAAAGGSGAGKRKRRNNPRRRPAGASSVGGQKRRGGGSGGGVGKEGKENSSAGDAAETTAVADSTVAKEEPPQGQQEQQQQQQLAATTSASSEDNSTVESRPVESGDGSASEKQPLMVSE